MRITIKQIAEMAGVSTATISRVINNNGYVNSETRRKIENLLHDINYDFGKNKKVKLSKSSDIVMCIMVDSGLETYAEFSKGLSAEFESNGYLFVCVNYYGDIEKQAHYIEYAIENNFAGVIMTSAVETPNLIAAIEKAPFPIVLLNRYLRSIETDTVCTDNLRIGYTATRYLIEHGHTKIAHIAGPFNSTSCQDRGHGFEDALHSAGLNPSDAIRLSCNNEDYFSGYNAGVELLKSKEKVTAIFAHTDCIAAGVEDAYYDAGFSVPDDLSIISVDDTNYSKRGKVKLTAIRIDNYNMGKEAAKIFINRLNDINGRKIKLVFSAQIVERDSVKTISAPL